jgi:hypothetical protein
MSNFDFLHAYDAELADHGRFAEKDVYDNPKGCVGGLRIVGEGLTKLIVVEKHLYLPSDRNVGSGQGSSNFEMNLKALQNAGILRGTILSDFHQVRMIGNKGSHPGLNVAVQEAKLCLEAAYRIAAWYVRDFKGNRQPIPEFVLPQPSKPVPPDAEVDKRERAKSLLDTPIKRITAGILSAFGLIWLLEIYLDPEHRWHVALEKTIRIAFVLGLFVLMVLPFALVADKVTLWQLDDLFVKWLEPKLPWNRYLIQSLVLVLLLPFLYAARLSLFSRNREKRRLGTMLLISIAVGFNLMLYFVTQNIAFDKWYWIENNRIVIYDRPGLDPQTGRPLQKVTPVIAQIYENQKRGIKITRVDPGSADWFSSIDGEPTLWFDRLPGGELALYNQPGNDPHTGDSLSPVTKDLYSSWIAARKENKHPEYPGRVQSVDPMIAFRKTLIAGSGKGEPGVLLLRHAGADQEGTEAMSRCLAGVNTTALQTEALERHGYAARLLEGDEEFLREGISYTRLMSLVVADVSVQCGKKGSLDADLLTCDVAANAHKYDRHGAPAGSVLARGTGAGFSQTDALELAAKRASAELVALARQ